MDVTIDTERIEKLIWVFNRTEISLRMLTPKHLQTFFWRGPGRKVSYRKLSAELFNGELSEGRLRNLYSETITHVMKTKVFADRDNCENTIYVVMDMIVSNYPNVLDGDWPISFFDWKPLIDKAEQGPDYKVAELNKVLNQILSKLTI